METRDSMVVSPQVFGLTSKTEVLTAPVATVKKNWTLMKILTDGDLTVVMKDDTSVAVAGLTAGIDFGIHDVKTITFTGNVLVS